MLTWTFFAGYPINRTKRLYLETVRCGVVRVEHGSTKNEVAVRSAATVQLHRC